MALKDSIVHLLRGQPGLTDREITDHLFDPEAPQQPVNGACRALEAAGMLGRRKEGQRIRNYLESVPPPQDIKRLIKIGFRPAGEWALRDGRPAAEIDANAPTTRNVLYAFVTDGVVRYVGKTRITLSRRLYGYQNPGPTQRTNIRNHALIKAALGDGERVDIYVMPDSGQDTLGEFQINLPAALEDSIIQVLSPDWNG